MKNAKDDSDEYNGRRERGEKRKSEQDHKMNSRESEHRGSSDRKTREGNRSEGKHGHHVSIPKEQKTKISHAVHSQRVRVETNVNFKINVGVVVPTSVHFYTVPTAIVEVYPEYRGYYYFVAEDEIIVVEPRTREIVVVLPYV